MPPIHADYQYDLVTIGGGSGGVRASRWSAGLGAKVACIELPAVRPDFKSFNDAQDGLNRRGGLGGTCVTKGCVPKKLLMLASSYRDELEEANANGWTVAVPEKIDLEVVMEKKRNEIVRLEKVYGGIFDRAGVETIVGHGKVVGPHEVEVTYMDAETYQVKEVKTLTAKYICIATGSKAFKVPIPGKEHAVISDDLLALDTLPESMVMIGAGYSGLEMAQIYANFGTKVHVVFRKPYPLAGFDEDVRKVIAAELGKKHNLILHANTLPLQINKLDRGYSVELSTGQSIVCDLVAMAAGRVANCDTIGDLKGLGVEFNDGGSIKVDEYSSTKVPSIKAIGDVTGRMELTPAALMEGTALAETLFGPTPIPANHDAIPSAVFTQPPVAAVGLTEEQALEKHQDLDIFTSKFRPMKFIFSGKDEKVFMKMIVASKSQRVLGIHIVGLEAAEIIQGFAVAVKAGLTKQQVDQTVGLHPSSAEELVTMRTASRKIRGGSVL